MNVALLYFDDCPSWRITAEHLEALSQVIPELTIHRVVVDTVEAAAEHGFHGSPSIQVNGQDLFAAKDSPVGLACRIYQTPDGPAGSPTLDQIRQVIEHARATH